ncbi:enoyl-CoA hydratase-related protein [Sphingomonas turrisvirgatae]|uniref:2-(1,2-epoxy-1,2-dihydrophenyl)acetyl-CoA isomerase n=1 Tax=Sphingomonas turrisvirgatae TaxID=1888892 RepID=A0A1E3LZD7_9SPHN|nr:enoyl-CoA hydratase-related protein [Sphingomonas turrisvirgatae]ODP38465.1 2-(1,2-epoxy-1,2-dihydrophenyl)acetyl-CoA isomerase [Sphingomonas turrisvirgatae]
MDAAPSILSAIERGVAVVRLNRPHRLNALTLEMLDRLRRTLTEAVDAGARAVLVAGEGRAFCSGADLSPDEGLEGKANEAVRTHYNPLMRALADLPIPVVTAINGAAAGAGASIALAGDIVVAARSSYLLLAFANIGLVPDAGATWLVAKAAGRAKLLEMALLGERLEAADALEAGLVARVGDDAALHDTAIAYAVRLAAMPTVAMGLIRKQAAAALSGPLDQVLEIEAAHQAIAAATDDFTEGLAAFADKRPPVFRGR